MDATAGVIGKDRVGQPIKIGGYVCWAVKGQLRIGLVMELHHTYSGKTKRGPDVVVNYIRADTHDGTVKRPGRGGVFREMDLISIPQPKE